MAAKAHVVKVGYVANANREILLELKEVDVIRISHASMLCLPKSKAHLILCKHLILGALDSGHHSV